MSQHDDALHQGFDSGNYGAAYVSEDFNVASGHDEALRDRYFKDDFHTRRAWSAAYIIGFFSSLSTSEVPEDHVSDLIDATSMFGPRMRAIGIAVPERSWNEIENVLPEE